MRPNYDYDESGNAFYYVIIAFYTLVLVPLTYFLWPVMRVNYRSRKGNSARNKSFDLWKACKRNWKILLLLALWALFAALAYKISTLENTYQEYDPYKKLGIDKDANMTEIKKKYRELSKTFHPDKGGNNAEFDEIAKAYQSLTNEEAMMNLKHFGNPEGQKVFTVGIGLPKLIFSAEYGSLVLALYMLIFWVILPGAIGFFFYKLVYREKSENNTEKGVSFAKKFAKKKRNRNK